MNTWSHPVVANGRLYIRDQAALLSYDVKQNPTSVRAAAARRKPDFAVFPLSPSEFVKDFWPQRLTRNT